MDAGDLRSRSELRSRCLVTDGYLEDDAVVVGADVLPIDATPFVAYGWAAQMTRLPIVDALAAAPVLVLQVVTFSPVVVANVLIVVMVILVIVMGLLVVMILIVVMVLRDGNATRESDRQCRRTEDSTHISHAEFPPEDKIPMNGWMLFGGRNLGGALCSG